MLQVANLLAPEDAAHLAEARYRIGSPTTRAEQSCGARELQNSPTAGFEPADPG